MKHQVNLKVIIYVLIFLSFTMISKSMASESPTQTWAEGICDPETETYYGATRDFYNRQYKLSWENQLGDWLDANLAPQGAQPFAQFDLGRVSVGSTHQVNVTNLVQHWLDGSITDHGFLIKRKDGEYISFYSKEFNDIQLHPKLIVNTTSKEYILTPTQDTDLQASTYVCRGNNPILVGINNVLLKFDLSEITGDLVGASLELASAKQTYSFVILDIFATSVTAVVADAPDETNSSPEIVTESWTEGVCDSGLQTFEGATRDYFDRGKKLAWNNFMGDWIDAEHTPQGSIPFANIIVTKSNIGSIQQADVTSLVTEWINGTIKNQGFITKLISGEYTSYFSKENTDESLHPKLIIQTQSNTYILSPEADTDLQSSTYICHGNNTKLVGINNMMLKFDLPVIEEDLISASLELVSAKQTYQTAHIGIFATTTSSPRVLPGDNNFKDSWAEGSCNAEESIYQGATRDFVNRGTSTPWREFMGDWLDVNMQEQGEEPFSSVTLPKQKQDTTYSLNISELVKKWTSNSLPNHGLMLKASYGEFISFYSKESTNPDFHPLLKITTQAGIEYHTVQADTELKATTYICKGNQELLGSNGNILIRFDDEKLPSEFDSAELLFTTAKTTYGDVKLGVYAINVHNKKHTQLNIPGIIDGTVSDIELINNTNVILIENFETPQWHEKWRVSANSHVELVTSNNTNFPQGNSSQFLKVTIPAGENTGSDVQYMLTNSNPDLQEAYFRYNLAFDEHWFSSIGGKLPGFASLYQNTPHQGGWGGRKSDGTNGWSTRGVFNYSVHEGNPLYKNVSIGNYLYHADMQKEYGDVYIYDDPANSLIEQLKWYSVEQYVKVNTPGMNDGILRAWVNGILVFEKTDIRYTDNPDLRLERVWLNVYHGGVATAEKDMILYIDDVVIAKEYIGPRRYN